MIDHGRPDLGTKKPKKVERELFRIESETKENHPAQGQTPSATWIFSRLGR